MTAVAAPDLTEQAGALAGRLFESTLATMELETVYLGLKLSLYEALARPATAGDLAGATGLGARYVREWCEQQAVAGFLEVDDPAADPDARVFSLPAAHALVLTEPSASYDVVFVFEALHDMAHPVPALRSMREALRPGGRVVVMDEATMDEFGVDAPPPERLFYAASVLHCLPVGMSQEGSAGTGALMRPTTLRAYAADAGFADVQVAPVEHDLMRFYVLTP